VERINLFHPEFEHDADDPDGYRTGYVRVHEAIGGTLLAGKIYEVPPGQSNCPYHYEYDEEWLIVLQGKLTVRHPDGEEELDAGDLVCFPAGPRGAHKLTNRGTETVRMFLVSTRQMPQVAVYPDSDKIGVFTEERRDDIMVKRSSGVDYWDGES
jgi:uncharacterized cupin superfamily protein